MSDYKKILCATDFSAHCTAAAERAADLARRYDAELTLVHVVEYFPEERSNQMIAPEDVDPATFREQQAHRMLAELATHLGDPGLRQEVRFSSRSATREIIRLAEEHGADLIVVASHGRHGITAILGSTANGVLQGADCDVLSVRARD